MTDKYPQFTEEHEMFRKQVRNFAEKELAPNADEWEEERHFPDRIFKQMGDLGFLGARFPTEVGGVGGDIWHTAVFCEEMPRCKMAGLTLAMLVQSNMATPIINEIGTDEQKEEFLTPAIKGEKIAALGVSEPDAGSDVAGIKTTAKKEGDEYVINGQKTWITNGTRADFITLAARTDRDNRYGGISLFLFPTDVDGFEVGKKLKKIGNRTSDTAELFFDDCRIPERYLLGNEGHGFYYIMQNFQGERLVGAQTAVAGAQLILDETKEYCQERNAFGKSIMGFQVTRHNIVEMETDLEATRQLTYHAADLFERGIPAQREISMAKLRAGEVAMDVIDRCLQLHGGMGYVEEGPVARAWRDTRLISIGGGTSEIMKEIITKAIGL
ncbi:MAG: acyl-CoA dehydrogenase family protein [Persicimonas sp.]